jgi:hypothetical protein
MPFSGFCPTVPCPMMRPETEAPASEFRTRCFQGAEALSRFRRQTEHNIPSPCPTTTSDGRPRDLGFDTVWT